MLDERQNMYAGLSTTHLLVSLNHLLIVEIIVSLSLFFWCFIAETSLNNEVKTLTFFVIKQVYYIWFSQYEIGVLLRTDSSVKI